MNNRFNIVPMICISSLAWSGSLTESDGGYRETCLKAARDSLYFSYFRSLPDYTHVVEIHGGKEFADFLLQTGSPQILNQMSSFQRLDTFGQPSTQFFPGLGTFSATTLRYIVIADQIQRLFSLPTDAKIVEIGAGFGGQSFILSQLQPFADYYIYDLPEAEELIEKMTRVLEMDRVTCIPLNAELKENNVDLVISNFAFSECDRSTQMDYFERVIKKARRGYLIYNQISRLVYGMDSLSPSEFIILLKKNGINPKVYSEPLDKEKLNCLIVWDTTSEMR